MKIFKSISILLVILFVFFLPIMLLFTDVQLITFNRSYYEKQYDIYNVPEHMNIDKSNLMDATDKLLLYMDGKRENLDFTENFNGQEKEFFSERDKIHMIDVKGLFSKGKIIRNIALAYVILFLIYLVFSNRVKWKEKLSNYGLITFFTGTVPILLLVLLMSINFDKYFVLFHKIFFNNDFWLLDPAYDNLVNMFSESFFAGAAFKIAYYYLAELAVIVFASIMTKVYLRKSKMRIGVK